ncbi:axoneme-associated protein mst101(2)-like [Drosophila albomicans]|uniref:Axoneme-associated protein mst101(2)-like n=1 Tax=Drosophila albomicans TaxID=7291 RepID=A0A6P8YPC4_DROAB|nr:axoneme-associated protein mst101(2)-like [Drosophila albomicans]
MKLNMACRAQAGHKEFVRKHLGFRPTVLSSKRFEAILSRSRQDDKREMLAAVEEEQRYKQYLKDGNDALCKCFINLESHQANDDDVMQAARDRALAEETKDLRAQVLLDELRKERIMRANQILHLMKPGPRALRQALLKSELIKHRHYDESIKQEIAQDALRQKHLEDQQCPEVLIPFGHSSEEQIKAQEKEKSLALRTYFLRDLEERRQRKLDEKKQEVNDAIAEREKLKCQNEIEDRAAKAIEARKRELCRLAYKDALKEKAEKVKFEKICDQIDHRIQCVNRVAQRNLDKRYNKQILNMRASHIRVKEERAKQVCRLHQEGKRKREEVQAAIEAESQAKENQDEAARKCHREELAKQRRTYEQEERRQRVEKRLRDAEVRRFEIATRYKNDETNKKFFDAEKVQTDKVTADLRQVLYGQRQQFLQQRQDELMRMTACEEDPHLQDDVDFFNEMVDTMKDCQEVGRPMFPLAKAAERYQRDNQLDMTPEGQMIRRNTSRDDCWPGYFSKAELAYRKYEHREKCRKENEKKRHSIFDNCIKITKMASEEQPFKPCVQSGLVKCQQYRGIPSLPCIPSEFPNNIDTVPEKLEEPISIAKKESTSCIENKREPGGVDLLPDSKRDGISRSLVAKVSTKQKRSTKLPQTHPIKLVPSCPLNRAAKKSSTLLQKRSVNSPGSACCLAVRSHSTLKDTLQSKESHKVSSSKLSNSKLPDLTRYLNKNESDSVKKIEYPEKQSIAVQEKPTRLPDLTQYWTPNLLSIERKQKIIAGQDKPINQKT